MQMQLEKSDMPSVYCLPDGVTEKDVDRVLQDGFPVSIGNYRFVKGNRVEIFCSHPMNPFERMEVRLK